MVGWAKAVKGLNWVIMWNLQLIRLLISREMTLRYKRSVVGIGWTLLNPMLTSFILWVVFSYVFASKLPNGQQFAPYLMAGVLFINFFNQGIQASAEAIASNGALLTRVAVKPEVFTLSAAIAAFANFVIGLGPFIIVVYIAGQSLVWSFPLVLIVGICLTTSIAGLGLVLALLYIRFDDSRNMVALILMILNYLTPIFYPLTILDSRIQTIINLNPLTSFADCFRWAASNNAHSTLLDWAVVLLCGVLSPIIGSRIFKRYWLNTIGMF